MKSAYYTAVVTNTYKMAVNSYFSGNYEYDSAWYKELVSVTHRDYHTGYYFDSSFAEANLAKNPGYNKEKAYLATVIEYDDELQIAKLSQRNKMKIGDMAEYLTPGSVGDNIEIKELYDENMQPIDSTPHPYMTFYMKTPVKLKPGDIIRGA